MTFLFSKKQALKSYRIVKKWEPKNIIISHGPCIVGQAKEMLNQAFLLAREIVIYYKEN